jgi:uncharacterized protein (TIGR02145 family)
MELRLHLSESVGIHPQIQLPQIAKQQTAQGLDIRAYAINSIGTVYGNEISFTTIGGSIIFNPNLTYGSVTDIDGNMYKTITIGSQVCMAENLKTTKYRNNDLIGTTISATLDISGENTPKYQWAYDGDESYVATYGRLYTWYTVTDDRNICPIGWHVPSDVEWSTLTTYLLGSDIAGGKLKETGITHWTTPNTGATNETGFTALPGGYRPNDGKFYNSGNFGFWWSSTSQSTSNAYNRQIYYHDTYLSKILTGIDKGNGFTVRCFKD